MGNAAVKRAAEVRGLVAALAQAGVSEDKVEVTGVRLASNANLLGRSQSVEITLSVTVEPGQLPAALGILSDQSSVSLDTLEWVYETFEASIPLTARAIGKARRKAEAIATAAGVRITGIADLSDSWSMPSPRPVPAPDMMVAGRAMAAASGPLDLGMEFSSSTQISVHVTVDFEVAALEEGESSDVPA